jgi:hypothetical protein
MEECEREERENGESKLEQERERERERELSPLHAQVAMATRPEYKRGLHISTTEQNDSTSTCHRNWAN